MSASDTFPAGDAAIGFPATTAVAVTPSNSTDLANITTGIFIGGAGTLKIDMPGTSAFTFTSVAAGVYLPLRVKRVYATGTTATNIVALYASSSLHGAVTAPPTAYNVPVTSGTNGVAYTGSTPTVFGGAAAYVWSISSGPLPTGLSINSSTGQITGTPSVSGSFPLVIRVTDGQGEHYDLPSFTLVLS